MTYGVSYRDRAAIDRVIDAARKQPLRRARQLHLGPTFVRRVYACLACGRVIPKGARGCDHCGAFICRACDEPTSANGGDGERCFECLVVGRVVGQGG